VEAIPTRRDMDLVVIDFSEDNILSSFSFPQNIVTDSAHAIKSMAMVSFFQKYNIMLCHSMAYYPQGNGLVESSNKSLINIIKKVLSENKKSWHVHLK
jgi:transposase InsO family protein